jgi:hypothetical protein
MTVWGVVERALLAVLLSVAPALADEPAPTIDHAAALCVVAGRYPEIEARVTPGGTRVDGARVFFRGDSEPRWSSVDMKVEGDRLTAILPKPPSSRELYYYIEASNPSAGTFRTTEFLAGIVAKPELCQDPERVAKTVDSASPQVAKGPEMSLTHPSAGGSTTKWLLIGAAGAAVATGVALASSGGHSTIPNGTYTGTISGFTMYNSLGTCFYTITVPSGGTISIQVGSGQGTATFSLPGFNVAVSQVGQVGQGSASETSCPTSPPPPTGGTFPELVVKGTLVSGATTLQSFDLSLQAKLYQGSLVGTVNVSGGPGGSWSPTTFQFNTTAS